MFAAVRDRLRRAYERQLERTIEATPEHIAVIQDGNRRYAEEHGQEHTAGHQAGAETTEAMLRWCQDFGIEELTLYAFSTENFNRPPEERAALFDLIATKLREFADAEAVHDNEIAIRVLGDRDRLPARVQRAIDYAETQTGSYRRFRLNVALAYGGRQTLLTAARTIAAKAEAGELDPEAIGTETIEEHLYAEPVRDVDLIIRTGGDKRTSNFLPWHANGNEAAVYFCVPYWPSFSRTDFLRGLRTYQHREQSRQQTKARRAVALLRALGDVELDAARQVLRRNRGSLPAADRSGEDSDSGSPPAGVSEE